MLEGEAAAGVAGGVAKGELGRADVGQPIGALGAHKVALLGHMGFPSDTGCQKTESGWVHTMCIPSIHLSDILT